MRLAVWMLLVSFSAGCTCGGRDTTLGEITIEVAEDEQARDKTPSGAAPSSASDEATNAPASEPATSDEDEAGEGQPPAPQIGPMGSSAPALPADRVEGELRVYSSGGEGFRCGSGRRPRDFRASSRPGAIEVTIAGQGPCPGEVRRWRARARNGRVDIDTVRGDVTSRCLCHGETILTVTGVTPGQWEVRAGRYGSAPVTVPAG